MNILYINHYAGSLDMGMEFRPYYLAREWVRMGHNVRIVSATYSHLRKQNPSIKKDFEIQMIDGIEYQWIKTCEYQGNGVARAGTMFEFCGKLNLNASRITKDFRPDAVIASSTYPLDTYPAQRIAYLSGAILIHEVHDMWPITLIELGGMSKTNPFVVLLQIAENSFCSHSDYVVSLLCAAKDYFIEHGMKAEKFRNVMNGIVLSEWESPEPLPPGHCDLLERLHKEGKFIICFFGSITKSYSIDYLIEALRKIDNSNIALVIVGEGNYKEEIIRQTEDLDYVFVLDKINKAEIPTLLDNIDCCYVGALRNDMFRFGICMNKLFDSMMSGKPLLYAVEAPNNFVEDYGCGISVAAEDSDALAEGINKLLACSDEQRAVMGSNGRKAVIEHYTYEKLAKQFIEIIEGRN